MYHKLNAFLVENQFKIDTHDFWDTTDIISWLNFLPLKNNEEL